MFKTIIWATDGSESADRALPTALDLTAEAHGRLLVVHADAHLGGRAGGVPVIADEENVQSELVSKVNELVESGIDASFRVVKGTNKDPADLIAAVATDVDADVIVVGTRGHGRVAGMLLGSVTQRLLHVAPCPVLAVPAKVAAPDAVGAA
jgi:nucleotide-binding universal stress UspA family protein